MPSKQNNPGGESLAVVVARIDVRTKGIAKDVGEIKKETKERLDNHAGRLREMEMNASENKGERKGREFSFKRIATWVAIIVGIITIAGAIFAITPP